MSTGMEARASLKLLTVLIIAVTIVKQSNACYIGDCAYGGKRTAGSSVSSTANHAVRQCITCGPENSGQCVGPHICCGPFGCYFGTQESIVCQEETRIPMPCQGKGQSCGGFRNGKCVAPNTCCSENNCSFDKSCKVTEDAGAVRDDSSVVFKRAFKDLLEDKLFSAMNAKRR
ncbi:conopressin/conophysin-like [Glandiceps talaboti]